MIDTDKYEGHTSHKKWLMQSWYGDVLLLALNADRRLIEDAPLLLAEVKRLKAKLFEAELWVNNDSYTFENDIKELNDYLEAKRNE